MSTTINGTTVRLARDPEDWRKYRVEVLVTSRTKPGLRATQYMDPGKAVNSDHLIRGVGAAAALCAEYLGTRYKEAVDPSTCIRDAIRAFGEECRLLGELARGIPEKLQRLKGSDKLDGREREVLDRMMWLTNRGEKLTREEAELVNEWVGRLHGAQL